MLRLMFLVVFFSVAQFFLFQSAVAAWDSDASRSVFDQAVVGPRSGSLTPNNTSANSQQSTGFNQRAQGEIVDNFTEVLTQNSPQRVQTRRPGRRGGGRVSVDVYELPTQTTEDGQVQFACGSRSIRSHRTLPYMNKTSACMLAGMAQEWRQEFCPENTPDCQLLIGDASFGHQMPGTWPHSTHRRGLCVDIWPIRKAGTSGEVSQFSENYDPARTRQLVELMIKWGSDTRTGGPQIGNQLIFNDTRMGGDTRLTRILDREMRMRGQNRPHDDHIHVCFRDNELNRRRCEEATFDTNLCPGLGSNPTQPSAPTLPAETPDSYDQPENFENSVFVEI